MSLMLHIRYYRLSTQELGAPVSITLTCTRSCSQSLTCPSRTTTDCSAAHSRPFPPSGLAYSVPRRYSPPSLLLPGLMAMGSHSYVSLPSISHPQFSATAGSRRGRTLRHCLAFPADYPFSTPATLRCCCPCSPVCRSSASRSAGSGAG